MQIIACCWSQKPWHAFLQVYFHYPVGSSPLRPSDVKKAQERRSVAPKPKGLVFNTLTDGLETLDEVHGMGRAPGIGPKDFGGSNPSNHMTQSLERIVMNSYCIALEDWGSEFWLVWLVHGPGTLHFIVFHDFHVGAHCRLLPTRSICNENGWEFGPPAQRQSCEWLEAGNLHFHLTCLIQRFQHVATFTKLCFISVEPIEIGSSRFCEKKFAESFARRCPWPPRCRFLPCNVWELSSWAACRMSLCFVACAAAAQSVVQWHPRHLHADPPGHTALTVQRSESGKGKCMEMFFSKEHVANGFLRQSMCQAVKLQVHSVHSSRLLSNLRPRRHESHSAVTKQQRQLISDEEIAAFRARMVIAPGFKMVKFKIQTGTFFLKLTRTRRLCQETWLQESWLILRYRLLLESHVQVH